MDSSNKILNVEDIESKSMSDIVNLYNNGYKLNNLDTTIQGLTISTWLNERFCVGTAPNQTCIGYKYIIGGVGIIALVLLLKK
jgi:hypothetical protein